MDRYRKKPVEIEAAHWDGTAAGASPIIDWMLTNGATGRYHEHLMDGDLIAHPDPYIVIDTLEGRMSASIGDWIIRGVQSEFYPCRDDIFQATYEPVHEPLDTHVYGALTEAKLGRPVTSPMRQEHVADEPNLADRLADGARPGWLGSADTGEINSLTIAHDGISIEGVQVLVAGEPIRVETLADDMHIVHVALFVKRVIHDPEVRVETIRTYIPPSRPATSHQEPAMPMPTLRDDHPEPAQQTPVDERLTACFHRAFQLANEQGTATVGYRDSEDGSDIMIGYDVTIVRIGGDTPAGSAKAATPPTIGLRVLYTLNEADAAAINKRRDDYKAFQRTLDGQPESGARGATGHVAHVGNHARAGDLCPAEVVNTFGGPAANLQVALDGTDSYWATSRTEGDGPGHWAALPTAQ